MYKHGTCQINSWAVVLLPTLLLEMMLSNKQPSHPQWRYLFEVLFRNQCFTVHFDHQNQDVQLATQNLRMLYGRLERTAFYTRHPYMRIPTLIAMVGASIQISVPLCFGIFKQQASVNVNKLEDSLHNRVNRFGQPVTHVFYNKGV